jgi:hypothetical protein
MPLGVLYHSCAISSLSKGMVSFDVLDLLHLLLPFA